MTVESGSRENHAPASETKPEDLPEDLPKDLPKDLKELSDRLGKQIEALKKTVAELEAVVLAAAGRYVVVCPRCQTAYDMLAHHYSIGLFDNMVYVKCPKCGKSLPVQGGSGGGVRAVSDEPT